MDAFPDPVTSQLPPRVPRLLLHSSGQAVTDLPASVSSASHRPPPPVDDPQRSRLIWPATSTAPPSRAPSEDGSLTYRSVSEAEHGGSSRDSLASAHSAGVPRTYVGASACRCGMVVLKSVTKLTYYSRLLPGQSASGRCDIKGWCSQASPASCIHPGLHITWSVLAAGPHSFIPSNEPRPGLQTGDVVTLYIEVRHGHTGHLKAA